jgi:hypothetical protein
MGRWYVGLIGVAVFLLVGVDSCILYKRVVELEQQNKELHWQIRHLQKLTDRLAVKALTAEEHRRVWLDIQEERSRAEAN